MADNLQTRDAMLAGPQQDETRVEVVRGDREMAASNILRRLIYQHGGEQSWMDASTQSIRMGEQDDHWEVQAFARHRIAFAAPPSGEREAVAISIAQERHGSHDEHPTLYAACYEGALAAFSHPLPADREAIAREAHSRAFQLHWIAAARPPVHPEPMKGYQTFDTFDAAIAFMRQRASDAIFVSLTEIVTHHIDRATAALLPTPPEGDAG